MVPYLLFLISGYARTYIILPSTIYGIEKNGLTEAGIQNPHSIQVPTLIRASLDRGQGGVVGLGKNKWPNVHIDDGNVFSPDNFDSRTSELMGYLKSRGPVHHPL